eukprot:TRINITY_DN11290_c0_g1_i1.p1 TRINITY_DN11290_c0_g1~~TRINITY_DN11290_c0_g1_i1.p1  ORF type:complete len:187 (+),score=43.92 TRINITY_DN11290_c0_g1_i1:268-828(+)
MRLRLHFVAKGKPSNNSMICIPTTEDVAALQMWTRSRDSVGNGPKDARIALREDIESLSEHMVEPKHKKYTHKGDKKRKISVRDAPNKKRKISAEDSAKVAEENPADLTDLGDLSEPLLVTSRPVFGFVTTSSYSYRNGGPYGVGCCTVGGYKDWISLFGEDQKRTFVLVGCPTSRQYYPALAELF